MLWNRRHRRRNYAIAEPPMLPRTLMKIAIGAAVALLLFFSGAKALRTLGIGNVLQRKPVLLKLENRGAALVSLEEAPFTRAEDGLRLYGSDRVSTQGASFASLESFDETLVRLHENSEVEVEESAKGTQKSVLTYKLNRGTLWVQTPTVETYSGTILRSVETSKMRLDLPSGTEALIEESAVTVFSADGLGITLHIPDAVLPVVIGEGQQWRLPRQFDPEGDLYAFRTPVDASASQSSFIKESRERRDRQATGEAASAPPENGSGALSETLLVETPSKQSTVEKGTVIVSGRVAADVKSVRINGYLLAVGATGRFSQELALPNDENVTIKTEALSEEGDVLAEDQRTVRRDIPDIAPVTLTYPAAAGATYRTSANELEIRGTAPRDAVGIMVNDYRLQFFKEGDDTWSYLASTNLGNFKTGENIFSIRAVNAAGKESAAASITIILGEGREGVVSGGSASSAPVQPADLPNNDPLSPGSLSVSAPSPGASHEGTEVEYVLEGKTSASTASVWVNDYKLQLYEAGKTTWNYIASIELKTLKEGENTYTIVARDGEGKVLDKVVYRITKQ